MHGKKGLGDGTVPTNSEYPQPPSYSGALKDLPEGKIFHTLNYGKNLMGSHASQMTKTERWNVILYVQTLQKLGGTSAKAENNKEQEEIDTLITGKVGIGVTALDIIITVLWRYMAWNWSSKFAEKDDFYDTIRALHQERIKQPNLAQSLMSNAEVKKNLSFRVVFPRCFLTLTITH